MVETKNHHTLGRLLANAQKASLFFDFFGKTATQEVIERIKDSWKK
jgi:hypothetical protein